MQVPERAKRGEDNGEGGVGRRCEGDNRRRQEARIRGKDNKKEMLYDLINNMLIDEVEMSAKDLDYNNLKN